MSDWLDEPLARFVERIGEETPAPGGGSTAAVVIAMAAALVEMAARFSRAWEGAEGATARALAQAGYRVFGTSRREAPAPASGITMVVCDVTDDDSVRRAVESVVARTGRIDLLVNNAGRGLVGGAEESSVGQAQDLFDVNVFGILRVTPNKKGVRILEHVSVIPVANQIEEQQDQVEVFRQQLGSGLYKIWPMKPLEPGEYAVMEFTPAETEGIKLQAWDFSVK